MERVQQREDSVMEQAQAVEARKEASVPLSVFRSIVEVAWGLVRNLRFVAVVKVAFASLLAAGLFAAYAAVMGRWMITGGDASASHGGWMLLPLLLGTGMYAVAGLYVGFWIALMAAIANHIRACRDVLRSGIDPHIGRLVAGMPEVVDGSRIRAIADALAGFDPANGDGGRGPKQWLRSFACRLLIGRSLRQFCDALRERVYRRRGWRGCGDPARGVCGVHDSHPHRLPH